MPRFSTTGLSTELAQVIGALDASRAMILAAAAQADSALLEGLAVERARLEAIDPRGAKLAQLEPFTLQVRKRLAATSAEAERARLPIPDPITDIDVLHGRVADENGNAAVGLVVRARNDAGRVIASAISDANGGYQLEVPTGTPVRFEVAKRSKVLLEDPKLSSVRTSSVRWREFIVGG